MDKYIKLDRKILNCKWYKDLNSFKLFIHIFLKANSEASERKGIFVPRGAVAISYQELAEETGLSKQNVRTALNRMKLIEELSVENCGKFSIITVNNYDKYQGDSEVDENKKENIEHSIKKSYNTVSNTETNTASNTVSNTVSETDQTSYYQSFHEFEKVLPNTVPNTVTNTVANTVSNREKENLQYTYKNMDCLKRVDDFWDAYPRKEHRALSEQEYVKLFLEEEMEEEQIVEAAKNYAEYCKISSKTSMYIYMAHNWLKKGIWKDYLPGNYKKPEPLRKLGTGFTNFEQRDYDFDALEEQLLQSQRGDQEV